jgi:hypothetical protein
MGLADTYREFLAGEGFEAELDEAGDVAFRIEGRAYFLMIDDDDPGYFRLLFPNFWSIDSEAEHQRAMLAAAEVTAEIKVAKVYVLGDDTQASAEMFLADPRRPQADLRSGPAGPPGRRARFCEIMQDRRPRLRLVEKN